MADEMTQNDYLGIFFCKHYKCFAPLAFKRTPSIFISFTTDKIAICLGFYSSSEQHLYWRLVELKEVEFFLQMSNC